uniref:Ethanolaminephosphotransferase 1 n=1 Tax=Hucho hucho TaxID=62062 RepID=A0A4W5JP80_9TELE
MYEAFLPFLSPVLLFLLSSVWVVFSPSDILLQQPRVFYLMVGTAFANVTCKLIVCQMSNTRCQPLSWLLVPMATVVLLAVTGLVANETLLIYLWTAIVILTHVHYGVSVVSTHTHTHTHTRTLRSP